MAEQLLSSDPKAGQLLSADPSAGAPTPGTGTWEDRGIGGKVWHPADGARETQRVDNSFLGVPPELAVVSGIGLGRAVAGAGLSAAGRVAAGAKELVTQAAPAVKYEATKAGLEHLGVPTPLAVAAAIAVSGYRKGAKTEAATAGRAAESATVPPAAAPVAEAAPVAAPAAPPVVDEFTAARTAKASAGLPDQKALNEAALAARRAAYQARQSGQPVAADLPPAGPVVAASGKMQLTAPEMKEFARLIKTMPLPDALEKVKALRALAAMPGVASDAAAQAAIAARQYKR